ncbi:EamA family transporter [Roseisolibacter agri]|uniref:4-amino-4-deoxy-L-arabinose-phosphoundecaprenol flippase subunit ArnF n=1 Tax=Roseisolibacter agri TaxID=2014610 RepID=A0AA37Q5E4_9BACT|nr:EamA family transporter [Roseisolibacter agri]GLC24967.1 putative 4-amino-4-deoxy-L-arabinose-phosphoundecaprenol flippase subunit ArnF [Roseisolibacter agri]
MDARTAMLILGAVVTSAAGQLLLKSGAQQPAAHGPMAFLLAAARDGRVLAGIIAWGISAVCWLYVLRVAPLSRAYLLSSLTYVLVPLAGVHLFGESLRRPHVVGMVLILLGVACLLSGE